MYATNFYEAAVLNLMRGVTMEAPADMYVALFLSDPGETGEAGTEVTYSGYARQKIEFSAPAATDGGGIGVSNIADITFPITPVAIGTITHLAVCDSLTGGNKYLYGEFTESLHVQANEAPVIVAGEAQWWWQGNMSNAYKTKTLNVLRGTSCLGCYPHLALYDGLPESGGSELSGLGYSRPALTFSAPEEQVGGQMQIANSLAASTARAAAAWGAWDYTVIMDANTSGQPVWYAQRTPKLMRKGLLASVAVGALRVTVN